MPHLLRDSPLRIPHLHTLGSPYPPTPPLPHPPRVSPLPTPPPHPLGPPSPPPPSPPPPPELVAIPPMQVPMPQPVPSHARGGPRDPDLLRQVLVPPPRRLQRQLL